MINKVFKQNIKSLHVLQPNLHSKLCILIAVLSILFFPKLYAQDTSTLNPQKRPSQYILKYWNTENGLTSESTNDLIQSFDGYIWIGTYTGLHRFDGKRFTIFTADNSTLPSPNILRMDIDKEGILWMGTLHGVCKYENGNFIVPEALEAVKDFSIETIRTTKMCGLVQNLTTYFFIAIISLIIFRKNLMSQKTPF